MENVAGAFVTELCSASGITELAVKGGLLVGRIVPVVPAGGIEGAREFCVDDDDAGVWTPGASKEGGVVSGGDGFRTWSVGVCEGCWFEEADGDFAVDDDVAGMLIG